jgi:hypothetical protein
MVMLPLPAMLRLQLPTSDDLQMLVAEQQQHAQLPHVQPNQHQ